MSEITFTCPDCGHTEGNSLNTETGKWICFRASCGGRGKLPPRELPLVNQRPRDHKAVTLPPHWRLDEFGRDYLHRRGVEEWIIDLMPPFSTETGILFPFPGFEYWQERRWKQFTPPRWKNFSTSNFSGASSGVYYEVRTYPEDKSCVLVEGIIDALVVGKYKNAASTLSWHLHDAQLENLGKKYERLVYMPDKDVPTAYALLEYSKMPIGSEWLRITSTSKDPADLEQRGELECLLN